MNRALILLSIVGIVYGSVIPLNVPQLDGRIVGGKDTEIAAYPYQVSVRFLNSHSCGGSIVSKNAILTAGHCIIINNPKYVTIQYGVTDISDRTSNIIAAKELIRHEKYDSRTIDYDVALILLQSSIDFENTVAKPIPLANEVPVAGQSAVVTGWGTTQEGGSSPTILQEVQVAIVPPAQCQKQYSGVNDITDRMLCAGVNGGGKDACQGDSGGPLASNGQLIGIVSWGVGCARASHAGVYSNVAALRNWIDLQLNQTDYLL